MQWVWENLPQVCAPEWALQDSHWREALRVHSVWKVLQTQFSPFQTPETSQWWMILAHRSWQLLWREQLGIWLGGGPAAPLWGVYSRSRGGAWIIQKLLQVDAWQYGVERKSPLFREPCGPRGLSLHMPRKGICKVAFVLHLPSFSPPPLTLLPVCTGWGWLRLLSSVEVATVLIEGWA